jgi:hypothetical protein
MRSLETIVMPVFCLFPEGYISAFWEHNLEIRIGSKGWVGEAQAGMRWGWEQGLYKALPPTPILRMSNPVYSGLPLQPVAPPPVFMGLFVFPTPLVGVELECVCVARPQFPMGAFASASTWQPI